VNPPSHALVRAQQRGIPPLIIQWLDEFGEEVYDGHGAVKRYFSHKSVRMMERSFGRTFVQHNSKFLSVYEVVSAGDEAPITTGWRLKRLWRR
jgi:hypothetical protein